MSWFAALVLQGPLLLLRLLVGVLAAHFLRSTWVALRRADPPAPPAPIDWPRVTVQLPLRDEFHVARRVIEAACALDYPRGRLQIQILDDSGDETRAQVDGVVAKLRAAGHPVEVLRRSDPMGYKAGALAAGLAGARGEFIAIFDADCVPPPDFLRKTIPWFADPRIGCVQARWTFLNRSVNVLTRLQALVLDGLFVIDQYARAARDLPLQFNGTNGVWRRAAIESAGGWDPRTLAEDADISFRAYLAGWRVHMLRDLAVPTELPEDLASFGAQQHRWALGTVQLLRLLGVRVLRARIPLRARNLILMHLGRHAIDPLILYACVHGPLVQLLGSPRADWTVVDAALGALLLGSLFACYAAAQPRARAPRSHLLLVPLLVPLTVGMSLIFTAAWLRGLISFGGAFARTPKLGARPGPDGPRYRTPRDPLALVEIPIALLLAFTAVRVGAAGAWFPALLYATAALGFGWVGLGTIQVARRSRAGAPLSAVARPNARPEAALETEATLSRTGTGS